MIYAKLLFVKSAVPVFFRFGVCRIREVFSVPGLGISMGLPLRRTLHLLQKNQEVCLVWVKKQV